MPSLAELLVDSGVMTAAQLESVKRTQQQAGGSLDTNVLASGYLTEHALQQILERLWEHPPETDFAAEPSDEAVKLFDAKAAEEFAAVPQWLVGDELFVLMHDRAHLDEIIKREGLDKYKIIPVALNEVRLKYLLERFYKINRPERYVGLMDKLLSEADEEKQAFASAPGMFIGDPMAGVGQQFVLGGVVPGDPKPPPPRPAELPVAKAKKKAQPVTATPAPKPAVPAPAPKPAPAPAPAVAEAELAEEDVIPLLEEELLVVIEDDEIVEGELLEDEGEIPLGEGLEPLAAASFQKALDDVQTMDGLPEIFFRFGAPFFHSMALFKIQSDMVMGWRGAGLGIQSAMLRGIMVPTQSDTFLARGVDKGFDQGQSGNNPIEKRLTEQLGCEETAHVTTCAVVVGSRPVLVACGVALEAAAAESVGKDMQQLAKLAAKAVVRLIMAAKKARGGKAPTKKK